MNTGAPVRTAEYMALFRALESARSPGRRLFEDRDAERFLRPSLRAVARAARIPALRSLIVAFIDRRWPGPRLSGVVRTRVIDDFVTGALRDGCTQLLLLGAGYDTRSTRLAAAASSAVFEVDHPVTQARKRNAVGTAAASVRYVPIDLERDGLAPALTDAGFDADRRTCVVWEGVFSYLTPEAIDVTLAALVELCAPDSQIVLTYVDQHAIDAASAQSEAWFTAVSDVGEPFRTGLHPGQAAAFFAARGLGLLSDESTADAAARLGAGEARAIPGFYRLATVAVQARFDEPAPLRGPGARMMH
jgi:methyltransferase (TIGR00027 family)